MEAPTPVSCYLHSATMVKLGIFLLLLMSEPLGGTTIWFTMISTVGILSLVWGACRALKQTDLKAILAFSTVSQLGLIIALIGYGSKAAIIAAFFHMLNHSNFKGSLFLVAGMVDHATGTRDIRLLRGLSKAMPITSALALCSAFAMAGLPPFNGFLSKEMFFESSFEAVNGNLGALGLFAWFFPILAVAGSIFTFVYCMMIVFKIFYGGPLSEVTPRLPHEPGMLMLIPGVILVSGTVLLALFADPLAKILLLPATYAVTGIKSELHISFWHGFNLPLAMTVIVIVCGIYLYRRIDRVVALFNRMPMIISGNRIYDWLIFRNAIVHGANRITNFYMTGRLQNYIQFICISFILIVAAMMVFKGAFVLDFSGLAPVEMFEITWVMAMVAAAFIVVLSKSRTVSVLSLGIVGYSVAFFFVLFRAPDLALTQLVVETVSIVLFFLALRYLPRNNIEKAGSLPNKMVNLAISIAMGAAVTAIALIGHGNKMFDTIANFYIENAKTLGGGDNIVNVLLVDFRGLDTMGEITVISIAAIGVYILISLTVGEKNEAARKRCIGGENK
jgi:multicomponent Na+:H+ antiporter subunit A